MRWEHNLLRGSRKVKVEEDDVLVKQRWESGVQEPRNMAAQDWESKEQLLGAGTGTASTLAQEPVGF